MGEEQANQLPSQHVHSCESILSQTHRTSGNVNISWCLAIGSALSCYQAWIALAAYQHDSMLVD